MSMSKKKCCVPGCFESGKSHKTLHLFPNPVKNRQRFNQWVLVIGGDIVALQNEEIYKNRTVCHGHFEEKHCCRFNRLAVDAVPTLNLPGSLRLPKFTFEEGKTLRLSTAAAAKKPDDVEAAQATSEPEHNDDKSGSDTDYEEERLDEEFYTTFVKACIGCLSTDGELTDLSGDLRTALHNATGVQVDEDGPSSLCPQCAATLRKCAYFRTMCQRAQHALQTAVEQTNQSWQMAISTIDREQLNLTSRLSISNNTPEITIVFDGDVPEEDAAIPDLDVDQITSNSNIDDVHADDVPVDDVHVDDVPVDDVHAEEIDLNDVFKGLKEETASELESICDPMSIQDVIEVNPKVQATRGKGKIRTTANGEYVERESLSFIKKASMALAQAEIRYLSPQEQKEMHHKALDLAFANCPLFKCAVCIKVFRSKEDLLQHVKYHTARMSYKYICDICKNRFSTELECTKHSMHCHWYQYRCTHCADVHNDLHSLVACFSKYHSKTVLKEKHYADQFEVRTMTPEERYVNEAGGRALLVCKTCDTQFDTLQQLITHRDTHQPHPEMGYQCDICKLYHRTTKGLAAHMTMCHTFIYTCKQCGNTYSNRKDASRHFKDAHIIVTNKYYVEKDIKCSQCGLTFKNTISLNAHACARGVNCSTCGQRAVSVQRQYEHQLREHYYVRLSSAAELNDPRYYCIECRVYFLNMDAYFAHLARLHHAEAATYTNGCIPCALLFSNPDELKVHDEKEHEGRPPSKKFKRCVECLQCASRQPPHCDEHPLARGALCHLCGKTVSQQGMSFHMRTHSGDSDKWKCQFCQFSSRVVAAVVAHTVASHTHRPYMCAVCPHRFTHRYFCREHILKVHAPVLPYSCEVCGRRFAHLDLLNDHCVKIHHVNLKKTDKSVFLSKRMLGKIYVYPHMKIDATHVPKPLLEQLQLYLCDYMDENEKIVPHKDYLFFDPHIDPKIPTRYPSADVNRRKYLKQKAKKLRKKLLKELENKSSLDLNPMNTISDNILPMPEVKEEICTDDAETLDNSIDVIEMKKSDMCQVINSDSDVIGGDVKVENVMGELVIHDGQQYVLVGDSLYQFES